MLFCWEDYLVNVNVNVNVDVNINVNVCVWRNVRSDAKNELCMVYGVWCEGVV